MPTRLILDTDIGTDVDDCLALAVILGSPELHLEGVTCVYGDVNVRARMAVKLLQLANRENIPVMRGAGHTLLGLRDIFWAGHEGKGLLEERDERLDLSPEHAVDYIVRTVMENPSEIHLLAIGPLTNVALAIRREPEIVKRLGHLTIMGGAVRGPASLHLRLAEHNFACDPEAAHVVMSAGVPATLVPLDVTTRVEVCQDDLQRIRDSGNAFHHAVAQQVALYPRFADTGSTFLHDPLAAAIIVRPELVSLRMVHVAVETQGRLTSGASLARMPTKELPANAAVALDIDVPAAEKFILDRVVRAAGGSGIRA